MAARWKCYIWQRKRLPAMHAAAIVIQKLMRGKVTRLRRKRARWAAQTVIGWYRQHRALRMLGAYKTLKQKLPKEVKRF